MTPSKDFFWKIRERVDDKGEIKFALDIKIEAKREEGKLRISQETYISNMIKDFNLQETKGKDTPGPTKDITDDDVPTTQTDIENAQKTSYTKRNR